MAVHQYGLGFGIDDSFGENNRIAFRGKYLGMVGTGLHPVSYTHLDVYKRQAHILQRLSQCGQDAQIVGVVA